MASLDHRIKNILTAFPDSERFGFTHPSELEEWLNSEFGQSGLLDTGGASSTGWRRARALSPIYHICAGNISVSAETSLLIALLVGARSFFKLPSSGLPGLEARIERLPAECAETVELLEEHDAEIMKQCPAVVVFGSDRTAADVRAQTNWKQRLLIYGHKISIGIIDRPDVESVWAERAVEEILAYDQLGCLSPQSYLCPDAPSASRFSELLVSAFESRVGNREPLPFEAQAMHFEARQRAQVAGDLVVSPSEPGNWVVVERSRSRLEPGPGFGFVEVVAAPDLQEVLAPWRGLISSASISNDHIPASRISALEDFGIHRICRMGDLQKPPIAWPHDGRPRLADLVEWTFVDPALQVIPSD